MKRRIFIRNSSLAAIGSATIPGIYGYSTDFDPNPFRLNFAPHLGMFQEHAGKDPLDQLRFMSDQGFRAFEDNEMKQRTPAMQEKIGRFLSDHDMQMGVFVGHTISWSKAHLASGAPEIRKAFLDEIKDSVAVAQRVGATWITVVPGHVDMTKSMAYQTAHVVDCLRAAVEILEPHKLIMVLEPLNFRDHPGQFLSESPQAYEICRAVNSPSCKILFDIYHQQIQEGNLIPNIEACWNEIAYFQIGDNPGRKEPGTGEINYGNVFSFIANQGYTGILGMEHGNSRTGKEGEMAILDTYRKVDPKR